MVTPFSQVQRGNSITATRIRDGLSLRGYDIDLLSLDDPLWQERLQDALPRSEYGLLHGFNARFMGQFLIAKPWAAAMPFLLTTTGTDINIDLGSEHHAAVMEAMQTAGKIVVFHEDLKDQIIPSYPQGQDKLVVIPQSVCLPNPVPSTRSAWGWSAEETLFILPSGLRPVKNISMAIDALSLLYPRYLHLRLIIVGAALESSYSRPLLERISSLPWVTYLGEMPHREMGALLAAGDVVLNTSWSEGQPQAALEAMSLGLPCILTAVPGNLNLITNGQEGFYVHDEIGLIQAAQRLLDDPELRRRMGAAARALITSKYHSRLEMDAYDKLYRQLQTVKKGS